MMKDLNHTIKCTEINLCVDETDELENERTCVDAVAVCSVLTLSRRS